MKTGTRVEVINVDLCNDAAATGLRLGDTGTVICPCKDAGKGWGIVHRIEFDREIYSHGNVYEIPGNALKEVK